MANSKTTSSGVGFGSLLLLSFIILKLTKTIDWSWWWVLSPFWIPIAILVLVLIVYAFLKAFD